VHLNGDAECKLREGLVEIFSAEGGWSVYYHQPGTGQYWYLSFPESPLHGGGLPRLEEVSLEQVQQAQQEARTIQG
jgi:hypothetical protein